MRPTHTVRAGLVLAAAALATSASPAAAHIQVAPTTAAPNDPVEFRVLIPGEREQETTRVDLKVPSGVLPFSFGETPGWKRRTIDARNGAVDRIVWTGRLPHDGFVTFSFLASTPPRPGTLAWKALQIYSDGKVERWIGPPGSEQPAPTTRIVAGAPRQNAGGEAGGRSGGDTPAALTQGATPGGATSGSKPTASSADSADWIARGIALAALLATLLVIARTLARRRPPRAP